MDEKVFLFAGDCGAVCSRTGRNECLWADGQAWGAAAARPGVVADGIQLVGICVSGPGRGWLTPFPNWKVASGCTTEPVPSLFISTRTSDLLFHYPYVDNAGALGANLGKLQHVFGINTWQLVLVAR